MTERGFRRWFYAAAIYNAAWGALASLAPTLFSNLADRDPAQANVLWQTIGMIVGVYAYGYWLVARDPKRYAELVWLGLVGKVLGPIGFFVSAFTGVLPWKFGLTILTNDLMWWPVFFLFLRRYAPSPFPPAAPDS